MKKKLKYISFAFLLSFIFTACGTKESDGQTGKQTQQTTVPSAQPTQTSETKEVQTTDTNKQEEEETMKIGNDKEELEKQKECNIKQFSEPKEGEQIAEIVVKDFGSIFVRFFKKAAPKAVENFVTHAKEGYYDELTFHRVIKDFMIQGGDPSGNGTGGESIWEKEFEDEFSDDYYPFRGALCMANAGPNTNGSQFFIVQAGADVASIYTTEEGKQAYQQQTGQELVMSKEAEKAYQMVGGTPWLYQAHTVFGQMYKGYDVLDKIAQTETDGNGAPLEKVIIETIKISKYK